MLDPHLLILQTDLRVDVAPAIYMLDVSPYGGGICKVDFPRGAVSELWRHTEQRGSYTKFQQGAGLALQELGFEPEPPCGPEADNHLLDSKHNFVSCTKTPRDYTIIYDCIELFSGFGNWSKSHSEAGLRVHPGMERSATGHAYDDLSDKNIFLILSKLAYQGAIREWHAGPPCWSFGTLRRPRFRSKQQPAGFDMRDPVTREQTLLAIRTAFLLTLALASGC